MAKNTNSLGIPNPYGIGQGVFDSTPATRYYLMKQEQEKAKDLALDKSINDLASKVTPQGMRSLDITGPNGNDGFLARKNEWLKFGIDNKKAIKDMSDGGVAYAKFNEGYNKLLGDIERSKGAVKNLSNLFTMTKGNKDFFTEESMPYIDAQQKSIYDESYQPLDAQKLTQKPKFDLFKFKEDLVKGSKLNEGEPIISTSKEDPYTNIVTTPLSYSKPDVLRMGSMAASHYNEDPGFKYYINNVVSKELDPIKDSLGRVEESPRYKQLNSVFKKYTGTDMNISPNDLSDAAAAIAFEIASKESQDIKTQANFKAHSDETLRKQKEMAAISDANTMKHIAFADSLRDKNKPSVLVKDALYDIEDVGSQIKRHDPSVQKVEIEKGLLGGMFGINKDKRFIKVTQYDKKGKEESYSITYDPSNPKATSDAIIQAYKRHHVLTDAEIKKFNETPKVSLSKSEKVNIKQTKGKKLY